MSTPRHATTTVWIRAALVGALAAGCLLFLAPASRAATAPSLTLVFTNPSFATLAVDSDGVAYGAPSGSVTQVWRSTDEGRTWTQRSTFPSDYRLYYITPLRSGTLLAAVDTGSFAILRSADGGSSWTRVLTLPGTPCFYSTLTPHSIAEANGFVFVGTYNNCSTGQNSNYIYRSSDDGRTWSTIYTSTTHRHIHGIQYDPGTDALYVLYGDSTGDIERSTDDGASWQPICTTYDDCVGIDIAFGAGFGIYGTDTPFQQNAIERIDLASGRTARVIQLPRVSYSAYALSPSQFLVGTVREAGAAVGDGQLHLYASDDGGQSFSDVYSRSFSPSDNGPNFLQVQYSYPDGDFPIQGSSGTVVARLDGAGIPPPVNTELPSVSGTARQGQTLSASTGTWSGSPTSFAYRWRGCDASGAGCADVGTGSSYLLGSGDVGHTVRVVVTATNGSGSASATSAQTGVVAAGEWSVASSIAAGQVLSGRSAWTATVAGITAGEVASVDFRIDGVSKWTDHLSPYVFNGDGNTLDTTALANGSHTFTVVATATDGTTRSAQAVASVANAVLDPPVSSVLPSVSGTAQQGQTLSASTGTWSGSPTSFAYRWRDCDASGAGCVDIAGATGSSYLLQAADVGHTLRVVVTATNGSGSTPATSAQTGVVAAVAAATNGSAPPPPSGGSGGGGGGGGVGSTDLAVSVAADSATANVGETMIFRVKITDVNGGPAPSLHLLVSLPANGTVVSTYSDRGPGCRSTGTVTLDCDVAYLSGDSTVGNLIIQVRLVSAGPATLSATATFQQVDAKPADNTGSYTVNQAPAGPPVVPPVVPAPKPKPVLLCVVPKLKGLTLAQARLKVKRAHCTLAVKGVHLAAVKLGRISSQSPRPGARVKRGSRLHVVISLGARKAKRHGATSTH